jgi:hypothetical protein
MPGAGRAELIFIAAMMILILIVCGISVFFFFKTYKKEMRDKEERKRAKRDAKVDTPQ